MSDRCQSSVRNAADKLVVDKMYSRIDLQTHAGSTRRNPVTLTFDILKLVSMYTEGLSWSISTDFGVDSPSRFPFRVRTDRQTNRQADTQLITVPMLPEPLPLSVITVSINV